MMLYLNEEFQETSQKFPKSIQRKFKLKDLTKKLRDWYMLTYADFIRELGKKNIKLSLSEEAEWEDYFLQESKKGLGLKAEIKTIDAEINSMIYELYELNEEEFKMVE